MSKSVVGFLEDPPHWILATLVVLLAMLALGEIRRWMTGASGRDDSTAHRWTANLIEITLLITGVVVIVHTLVAKEFKSNESWRSDPFVQLVFLMIFGAASYVMAFINTVLDKFK